jgi:hypothetical protein
MASPKKNYNELSDTAKYYRNNPSAREKKAETDKEINARPEQKRKRAQLVKERRKRGIYGKGGADLSHTTKGLIRKSMKKNRGSKTDSQGDKNARG